MLPTARLRRRRKRVCACEGVQRSRRRDVHGVVGVPQLLVDHCQQCRDVWIVQRQARQRQALDVPGEQSHPS